MKRFINSWSFCKRNSYWKAHNPGRMFNVIRNLEDILYFFQEFYIRSIYVLYLGVTASLLLLRLNWKYPSENFSQYLQNYNYHIYFYRNATLQKLIIFRLSLKPKEYFNLKSKQNDNDKNNNSHKNNKIIFTKTMF